MTKEETRELVDIMQAYVNGKQIQVSYKKQDDEWEDTFDPLWDFNTFKYRIKTESKYRPYTNAEEFLKAMKRHGPLIKNTYQYMSVLNIYWNNINLYGKCVVSINFQHLYADGYTWQDGTPCGILEKQLWV